MWQLLTKRLQDRQSANTRIEYPYRILGCNHLPADVVMHSTFDNHGVAAAYYHVKYRGNDRTTGRV